MPYYIEILCTKESLYKYVEAATSALNKIQNEFVYQIPANRLRESAFGFVRDEYLDREIFDWLKDYRSREKGNRSYLILVIDGFLSSNNFGNLFGSHFAQEGLATFTTHSVNQFVFDTIRYCRYYFLRYTLSFLAPEITSHETRGCLFDKKIYKRDLLKSLDTGNLCDDCRRQLLPHLNPEISNALTAMQKLVANQHPFAVIMKGGGIKGLAFAGALLELEKYFSFNVFAGTSAGAIAAILLGAGYKPSELLNILFNKNFEDFKDASWAEVAINLVSKRAMYPGTEVESWIDDLVKAKYGNKTAAIKLCDLNTRTIVYASRISEGTLTFDSEGERKETKASFAARCSMSIPYIFIPPKIEGVKVFDGGLRNNFPLSKFVEENKNKLFIGLYLKSCAKKKAWTLSQLADIVVDGEERAIVDRNLDKIVVIDPAPIKTTQFNLQEDEKKFLILTGRFSATSFLKKNYPDFAIEEEYIEDISSELEKIKKAIWWGENLE